MTCKHKISFFPFYILVLFLEVSVASKQCKTIIPEVQQKIDETERPGRVVYAASTSEGRVQWQYEVVRPVALKGYLENFFNVSIHGHRWQLVLAKTLDAELIYLEKRMDSRDLVVATEDEYYPVFITKDITYRVPEGLPVGSEVIDLAWYVSDKDVQPINNPDKRSFYGVAEDIDKEPMFTVSQSGLITVNTDVDYDDGDAQFDIQVVVMDGLKVKKNSAMLHIKIININDNPPRFQYLGCGQDCIEKFYVTSVSGCFLGVVNHFVYGPINAIDFDNEPIQYKMVSASPHKAKNYVRVDNQIGRVTILKYLRELALPAVSFAIQAHDLGHLRTKDGDVGIMSEFTVLLIYINNNGC